MPEDRFELDHELEELEKTMGSKFEYEENPPLRAEFRDELRQKLLEKLKETESQPSIRRLIGAKIGCLKEKIASMSASWKKTFSLRPGSDQKWRAGISIAMVVVILTAGFWGMGGMGLFVKSARASEVSIVALNSDQLGVDIHTAFLLSSKEPLNKEMVREALKINPEFSYELDKMDGGKEYKIIPLEALTPNTIYTLSFDQDGLGKENMSWAFQTKSQFQVIRSLPAGQSTHVPVNTGIEITFSHEAFDPNTVKDYFSISPSVEGTFEKHKKTLVFVPKELQPATIYTVTLKKGLPLAGSSETLAADYLFSFETAPLQQESNDFVLNLDTELAEFSTSDKPVFSVYLYNDKAFSGNSTSSAFPVHIDLYRYPGYQEFQASLAKRDKIPRWSYIAWNQYREALNPDYKTAGYDTEFLSVDAYTHYIVFPEPLQPGYYAAEFSTKDSVRQVWFQVSDLSVYLSQGTTASLFWANDLKTQAPASGVEVTIAGKGLTVKGDDRGVAVVRENLFGAERDYALVRSGAQEILVPLERWQEWYPKSPAAMDYWKYLYLDRELYKPGDTVNFWGVISARNNNGAPVGEISMELWGTEGPYYEGAEAAPILTQKVKVNNKTFSGQMKLPVLKPGYYYIQIKTGDLTLLSRGLSVETYQKPAYQLSLTQDKKAIFIGEKVNFLAKTAFFEGTPVPRLKLNYSFEDQSGTVTTDEDGKATISCTGSLENEYIQPYRYVSLNASAALPEAGEISATGEYYVFKSKVYLTGEAKRTANGFTLNAKLQNVDLTDINNGQYLAEEHFLKGAVPGSKIKAALYQEIWTPVEAGRRYDFISKQVVPVYQHTYKAKHLGNFELTTGADGTVSYNGVTPDPKGSYYLDLTAEDSQGRPFTRRIQIGGITGTGPDYQYYFLQGQPGVTGYQPGEEAQVTFMVNDKELVPAANSVLFYRGQKEIDAYEVSGGSRYSFTFAEKDIPNVNVFGVYFDGYSYYEASPASVVFAKEAKTLAVSIDTDKPEYRPGETVKLAVQVSDLNQMPAKDIQVNLNLVDEALFSLSDQNVNFLNSLYGDHFSLFQLTRKSHYHPGPGGGAERGGEGAGIRQDFRDTVLFTTLRTDANGRAAVEFQLPDNLTSWRVTYHAFSDSLQAASGTEQIPVKLPFFLEMTLNQTYLAGDTPVIVLRSYGEQLKSGQTVSYNLKLTGPDGQENSLALSGTAFTPVDWQLPVLEAGKYRLTASAQSGGLQDSLAKEFTVVKSLQERLVTQQELLQEGMRIQGPPEAGATQEPIDLIFCDYEKSQIIRGLYQLAWNNGSRLEQKLAAQEAAKLLKEYFPDEVYFSGEEQESLQVCQQADGGLSILPYAQSELKLTAMVAAATAGIFDDNALAGYFYRILESEEGDSDDRSLALLGLASLKQPVLLQIKEYQKQENLEPAVKINLALALLEIGDGAYAGKVYRELMTQYAEDLGAVTRMKVEGDQDDIIAATAQMAMLAARLDQPEKGELYQYLLENPGRDILTSLEQLQILQYYLKYMQSAPVGFTYELGGSRISKTLQDRETFKLTVLPADLPEIRFSGIQGKVGVLSKYSVPIQPGEQGIAKDLSVSRTYTVNGVKTTQLNRTDLVKVVIDYNIGDTAPNGIYEVVDILPAGLSYISRPYNYNEKPDVYWDYPAQVKGQKVTFLVGKGRHRITYLARVISPGEFTCEAPLLSNIKNSTVFSSGSGSRIVIK